MTDLIRQNIADRTERMAAVHALTDAYLDSCSDTAPAAQLERLSNYILREELTDMDLYKVQHNEYPFLSEHQFNVRRNSEVGMKVAEEHGTDGRNYAQPKRRTRTRHENNFVDMRAKSRNKERAAQYRKDTAAGAVKTYNLYETGGELAPEFTGCKAAAQAWKERLSVVY